AKRDLTQHAELIAIQDAMRNLDTDRLDEATLCITLEPCAQCAGAIVLARVGRVVFGAYDPKAGMAGSVGDLLRHPKLNHHPEVIGGVMEEECGAVLKEFFEERR
ncbi:MAG: nucleoside deaminase, partial [Gemmatimonadales bacterium]